MLTTVTNTTCQSWGRPTDRPGPWVHHHRAKGRVSARPGSDASPTITAREGASGTPAVDDEAVGRGPTATRPPAPVIGGSRPNPRARHLTRENVC